ncbi:hypothetical protein AVEN_167111-1 [Araneus ventricosus]|uniref:Uncharacterized protein n=1 Tax=Araneus ventricosus TaxID=182803 RepID=A0A4Y2LLJ0_ARAVE|nr:hypothetical protein AVEN_167111-1 [Araneus ventricosus]
MLPHRARVVALGGMGDARLEFFSWKVTQGVKAIPLYQLKHKGNRQSQTSSLGRQVCNNCTLLLYHESFAYGFGFSVGRADSWT